MLSHNKANFETLNAKENSLKLLRLSLELSHDFLHTSIIAKKRTNNSAITCF